VCAIRFLEDIVQALHARNGAARGGGVGECWNARKVGAQDERNAAAAEILGVICGRAGKRMEETIGRRSVEDLLAHSVFLGGGRMCVRLGFWRR
jgi:hypothetical protein